MNGAGNAPLAVTGRSLARVGIALALAALLYASAAQAETFTVTNTSDRGAGSLRVAIAEANSRAGADEIAFADGVGGTITLGSQLPTITDPAGLTIDGGGDVTVSGNHVVGIVSVGAAKLALRSMTLADGTGFRADLGSITRAGGAIYNGFSGTLDLADVTLSGNSAVARSFSFSSGGGISNYGTLTVANSAFSGNSAEFGGGIYNGFSGTAEVRNSIFSNNSADNGGGIYNDGTLTVAGSSVVINEGVKMTPDRFVTLKLKATDSDPSSRGVTHMRIRNAGAPWSAWRRYATSKDWVLSPGEGSKIVYVQFRDAAGNVSTRASDSITYRR